MPEYRKGEFGTRAPDYLQPHRKTVRSHSGAAYGKGAVRRHGAHGQTENGEAGVRPGHVHDGIASAVESGRSRSRGGRRDEGVNMIFLHVLGEPGAQGLGRTAAPENGLLPVFAAAGHAVSGGLPYEAAELLPEPVLLYKNCLFLLNR